MGCSQASSLSTDPAAEPLKEDATGASGSSATPRTPPTTPADGVRVLFLPIHVQGLPVLIKQEGNKWLVDNSKMQADIPGISYRIAKTFNNKPVDIAEFGTMIEGSDEGDGWVRVVREAASSISPEIAKNLSERSLASKGSTSSRSKGAQEAKSGKLSRSASSTNAGGKTVAAAEVKCVCGNIFMEDSMFCRMCGKERPNRQAIARSKSGACLGALPLSGDSGSGLLGLLRGRTGSPYDVWLQASFGIQLQRLTQQHPYLEPGYSAEQHPLHPWMTSCRENVAQKRFKKAHEQLHRILTGLEAERELAVEAFRYFKHDDTEALSESEWHHMCQHLGFSEDELTVMDLNGDGKVTVEDMQRFVGHLGGVHQFFYRRRLRITTSRVDVSDYMGLAVGARVRAHFYIMQRKSDAWREAVVVQVGVEKRRQTGRMEIGPATYGVLLEFGFGPGDRWRTTQIVPPHWILGGIEDASAVTVMKEIGMFDGQQSLWAVLLPESEMLAMKRLTQSQRNALNMVRTTAIKNHNAAYPGVLERFKGLHYGDFELHSVLGWIQDLAPLTIHVQLDDSGRFLETDEFYRSQFETLILHGKEGKGNDKHARHGWESRLFGGCYDEAEPFERVKYGAINITNDYKGVRQVYSYGDSYMVLKDVRLRTSFTYCDSCACNLEHMGTLDYYAHVLKNYSDREIHVLVAIATSAIAPEHEGARADEGRMQLRLLRGLSADPTAGWVTMGFPGLKQKSGRYYFEVQLIEGCKAAQVGVLSSKFEARPYVASNTGVGDNEHGWAVSGQHCARWHKGRARTWEGSWPCKQADGEFNGTYIGFGMMTGGRRQNSNELALSEDVIVGVAVDLDNRILRFSTNGVWDKEVAFGPDDIPKGLGLYPAISLQGRAAFVLGPSFKHQPPEGNDTFLQWPGTRGGTVRVDCPEIGESSLMGCFKEFQVHGEVNLKRNVQRLVANRKYMDRSKGQRSLDLLVSNSGLCDGIFRRQPAHNQRAMYKNDDGAVIYWDSKKDLWKINDTEEFEKFFACAIPSETHPEEPPRLSWKVRDSLRGVIDPSFFRPVLEEAGVSTEDINKICKALTPTSDNTMSPRDKGLIFRQNREISFEDELKKVKGVTASAVDLWEKAIKLGQRQLLKEASIPEAAEVVETAKHPYDTKSTITTQEVTCDGAEGLCVRFASKTSTAQSHGTFKISAGGPVRANLGPGMRADVFTSQKGGGGARVRGIVVERTKGGQVWKVRLDRRSKNTCVTCPDGHTLVQHTTPRAGFGCDVCGKGVAQGTVMYGCRSCNYDQCTDCYDAAAAAEIGKLQEEKVDPALQQPYRPAVGSHVEALSASGTWRRATVVKVERGDIEWYSATYLPSTYVVDWAHGGQEDRDKNESELRPVKERKVGLGDGTIEDMSRYGSVQQSADDCFALCHEQPRCVMAAYGAVQAPEEPPKKQKKKKKKKKGSVSTASDTGSDAPLPRACARVGDEIASFALDRSYPLTPFSVTRFQGPGPAQDQGVETGWFLDIFGTVLTTGSENRKAFAKVLDGIGGYTLLQPQGEGESSRGPDIGARLEQALEAAFELENGLEELLGRLNKEGLDMQGVTMIFTNNPSMKPLSITGECQVTYDEHKRVGSEVKMFKVFMEPHMYPWCPPTRQLRVDTWLKKGPAQAGGVRADWNLDLAATRALNPERALELQDEAIMENPNLLLSMFNVRLVFKQPTAKSLMFSGSGPAGPERWGTLNVPGCSADFSFTSSGVTAGDAAMRWGIWALVLPESDADQAPVPAKLDALAEKWVDFTAKARGNSNMKQLEVERDDWDEDRLRALCARHGWEFEWMTEDGERRRRANERRAFFDKGGTSFAKAREAAEAAAIAAETKGGG